MQTASSLSLSQGHPHVLWEILKGEDVGTLHTPMNAAWPETQSAGGVGNFYQISSPITLVTSIPRFLFVKPES